MKIAKNKAKNYFLPTLARILGHKKTKKIPGIEPINEIEPFHSEWPMLYCKKNGHTVFPKNMNVKPTKKNNPKIRKGLLRFNSANKSEYFTSGSSSAGKTRSFVFE